MYDFTVPELNHFRQLANFTPEERALFEYRAAGVPMEICAENMNVSLATAKRISRRVNSKIIRICRTL
nr:MAG TPA: ECF sigma factor [Caudoviricetes sp.]